MSLLKPATVEQAAAKVGLFGSQGSGKTLTSFLMAIGLSKTYHAGAPIAMLDTENGSDYLVELAKLEGVPLLVVKSRAFRDMRAALTEAEAAGACVYLVDSYTHPWQELNDALKDTLKVKKLEFRHMDQLKSLWRGWTDQFLNSPLHVIVSGRLGYVWDKEEDESGRKTELVKLGTKMKSENEAGYEPSLLIEMEGIQAAGLREKQTRTKKGSITHHAYVLKDRWRELNGRTFSWPDLNSYKVGDYQKVFKAFAPHFAKLAIGAQQRAVNGLRTSESLFDGSGDAAYAKRVKRVQIVLEEIEGALVALWPGQDAKSKDLKRRAIETLFETRSWTAVSSKPLELLDAGLAAFTLFEAATSNGGAEALMDVTAAVALLELCKAKVNEDTAALVAAGEAF